MPLFQFLILSFNLIPVLSHFLKISRFLKSFLKVTVVALDYDGVSFTMTYLLDKIPNEETFAKIEVLGDYLS